MRRGFIVLTLAFLSCSGDPDPGQPDAANLPDGAPAPAGLAGEDFVLTNQARAAESVAALAWSPELAAVAQAHSDDMCSRGFFDHTNPDGKTAAQRITDAGISWGRMAENIAQGQTTAAQVHQTWMNSSGHRANILDSRLRKIGIGHALCGGDNYWTQVFTD